MKQVFSITLLLIAFVMTTGLTMAETDVTIKGEVRARGELSDRSFEVDSTIQTYRFLRSRVSIEAKKDGNATAFIQFQDSRTFGTLGQSGGLKDGKNVDIHQAYMQFDKIWFDGFGGKVGRFEVNFGNQRVFGGVGWSNVGRSWEGGMLWYANDARKLNVFVLKKEEENRNTGNADFDIYGFYHHCNSLNLDLFGIYEYDAEKVNDFINAVDRMSFGLYYVRKHKHMDYTLNFVMQMGEMSIDTSASQTGAGDDYDKQDISAYMLAFEAGYNFENDTKSRLAVGIDLTSGDDDATKIKSYSDLYPTAHKFQGYMDYFLANDGNGLMDIYLKGQCHFTDGWTIGIDGHMFTTAVDYTNFENVETNKVGMEFDLTLKTTSIAGAGIVWGLSYFMPEDDFAGMTDAEAGLWGYCQTSVSF